MNSSTRNAQSTADSPTRRFQIGISTILLFIAAVSSWLGSWVISREVEKVQAQLPGLRDAARELHIDEDEDSIWVVNRHKQWHNENVWNIYLPRGTPFRICLATDDIGKKLLTTPIETLGLTPGRHKIELIYENVKVGASRIRFLVDDQLAFDVKKPAGWDSGHGWSGASPISQNQAFDPDSPFVLYLSRLLQNKGNGISGTMEDSSNGILLWVEPIEP